MHKFSIIEFHSNTYYALVTNQNIVDLYKDGVKLYGIHGFKEKIHNVHFRINKIEDMLALYVSDAVATSEFNLSNGRTFDVTSVTCID